MQMSMHLFLLYLFYKLRSINTLNIIQERGKEFIDLYLKPNLNQTSLNFLNIDVFLLLKNYFILLDIKVENSIIKDFRGIPSNFKE